MRSTCPGCRFARGVCQVPVPGPSGPGPRIDLELGAGHSTPGYCGSTIGTDPAVLKMSSRVPGKILQLIFLWECRSLLEQASVPGDKCQQPVWPPKWELMAPIKAEDVDPSLKGMKDGAPGPDGRKLKDTRAIPTNQLTAYFNLWLLSGYLLSILREGVTVLLPQVSGAGARNEFCPITMSDIVARCFLRIMAQRTEMHLPLSLHQKAFRSGDKIADLVWFMQTIIKHHQDNLCPLNIAFMDMKKTFDSVSHQPMLLAAARLGVPPPFLG